jgi:hypothetical protein
VPALPCETGDVASPRVPEQSEANDVSKGHRDNHRARVKRGAVAFTKKAKRRAKRREVERRKATP